MLVLDQIKLRFSIIVSSETYFFSDENPPIIEGWTVFSVYRDRKQAPRGGGVLVNVSDKISFIKFVNMSRVFSSFEPNGLRLV